MDVLDKLICLEVEAAKFGFKWETALQIIEQIQNEINEVVVHLNDINKTKLQEEIGDLMHAIFSLCVFCQLDPLQTLEKSVNKFEIRFHQVKQLAAEQGLTSLNGKSFDELMNFWDQAKQKNN